MSPSTTRRPRSPRGAGGRLRAEIVRAARDLLVETGNDADVTLRAVARRVGIAAPSIYAHFADTDQIVQAVMGETFGELAERLGRAREGAATPRDRVVACCRAYVAFGAEQPALYALLFTRPRQGSPAAPTSRPATVEAVEAAVGDGRPGDLVGGRAFALLLADVTDAVADGSSAADDALAVATELWVAMHGLVLLRAAAPRFPWPDPDRIERELIERIALLA